MDIEKKREDEFDQSQNAKIELNFSDIDTSQVLPTQVPPRGAASGDPRTNGGSTLYDFYYYQESKATGRPPLPTNSSLQTLKSQPHASPYLGTDLRIAQVSNIGSFDRHLSTTGCAFATNAGIQN
ncbi:hypothetical protein HZH68_006873 [Vespula germanica]|uniref:Uncharacterized protein n=1 Tax=Vespula germanica TaxID=30212 RepID=A0A834K6N0_VESGE|nr:hypothetical protein HZH68_006873 [Vespula germanica]